MKLNSNTLLIIVIVLGFVLAAQAYFLIDFHSKNKALQKSYDLFEKQAEKDKEDLIKRGDSIAEVAHWILQDIASLNNSLEKIEGRIDKINSKSDDKKDNIRRITDVDSLRSTITNRYQR